MFVKIKISMKGILLFLLLFCSIALAAAYISQYFFGYRPCVLCIYQRIPYFVVASITILGLFFLHKIYFSKLVILFSVLALFVNSGIAFYHVGVEQKVFKMSAKCGDELSGISSLEELRVAINNKASARCDEPEFFFLGLSMAVWNMVFSFLMAIFTLTLLRRAKTI